MKIIIGTKNQNKIDVTQHIFESVLHAEDVVIEGRNAESGVPEAPHDEQTYEGARNRAKQCYESGGADFYVGIESGLVNRYGMMFEEAWAVVVAADGAERIGYSSGLMLPKIVVERMNNGQKHNEVMAYYDKHFNLPPDNRDTWSRYTGGSISRQVSFEESLRNALIQIPASERNLYVYSE